MNVWLAMFPQRSPRTVNEVLILIAVERTVLISIRPTVKYSLLPLLFAVFSVTATVTTGLVITAAPVPSFGLAVRLPVVLPGRSGHCRSSSALLIQ